MSPTLFVRNLALALVLLLGLGLLTATPALAQGIQSGGPFCAGNNYTLAAGQSVNSLVAFGCNVTIEQGATVRGDLADFGSNVSVAGTIGGNVITFGGNVSLTETAVVNGSINSVGGNIRRAAGAQVNGGVNSGNGNVAPIPPIAPVAPVQPIPSSPFTNAFNFGFNILGGIVTAVAFAALGALIVLFAPEPTRRVGSAVETKPLNVAGVGCLTLIVLPILGLLLVITVIGIPVALILMLAAILAWVFGWIAIGFLTGEKILRAFQAREILPVIAVILGVLILTLISQVTFIGWLVSLVVGLLGIGAVVLTRFGTRAYPAPPTMMMTPVAAVGASSVPATYTPSAVDVAAWEQKARQANATSDATSASNLPVPTTDAPPSESTPDVPPLESSAPPTESGEANPNP